MAKDISSCRVAGIRFGYSLSEPFDWPAARGDPALAVRQLLEHHARQLWDGGGVLVLGHRWQPAGMLDGLLKLAADHHGECAHVRLVNYLAWPDSQPRDQPSLQRAIHDGWLEVHEIAAEGLPLNALRLDPDEQTYWRVRSLTAMRRAMVSDTDIRVCLGGGSGGPQRRMPGLIEEALLTYEANKPLYLSRALGGIAGLAARVMLGERLTDREQELFYAPANAVACFERLAGRHRWPRSEGVSTPAGTDAFDALEAIRNLQLEDLARHSRLEPNEYRALLAADSSEKFTQYFALGLARLTDTRN